MGRFSEIINSGDLVLVDFYATWCQPCKQMHPVLEALKKEMGESIRILKIDVDSNTRVSATYNIQSIPTLLLFKGGQIVWRQTGAMTLSDLRKEISRHI